MPIDDPTARQCGEETKPARPTLCACPCRVLLGSRDADAGRLSLEDAASTLKNFARLDVFVVAIGEAYGADSVSTWARRNH